MDLQDLIYNSVKDILTNSFSEEKIEDIIDKQSVKPHFIPFKYRVFGGLLQSMNIQFGNYIEQLMTELVKQDGRYTIIEKYSGNRRNIFNIPKDNDTIIDQYISNAENDSFDIIEEFPILLDKIITNNLDKDLKTKKTQNDIDLLFKDEKDNYYYVEIKYNDDHDSGKAPDICRKFIKTYAYLSKELGLTDSKKLKPILFFFTDKYRANTYLPEIKGDYNNCNIYRGERFFNQFLSVKYKDVVDALHNFSETDENYKRFTDLYNDIMKRKI